MLDTYDALYRHSDEIKHILTSHEQGASFAADGYARATGRVGVCMATSGPGATNLVTGIANAQMDSIPLVAITGNVPLSILGKDSFQEVDIAGEMCIRDSGEACPLLQPHSRRPYRRLCYPRPWRVCPSRRLSQCPCQ